MILQQTIEKLYEMKLFEMAKTFQRSMDDKNMAELTFSDRFSMIVDNEWLSRQEKRHMRHLLSAKLKHQSSAEAIDYTHPRGIVRAEMAEILECNWIKAGRNMIITGATGLGKTWLACAIAEKACRFNYTALYKRVPMLLFEVEMAKSENTYLKYLNNLSKVDLLILDDWGLTNLEKHSQHNMLEIIDERCGKCSTLITSQLSISEWHQTISDPLVADAILDRLAHSSIKLFLKGESMRKTSSEKEVIKST